MKYPSRLASSAIALAAITAIAPQVLAQAPQGGTQAPSGSSARSAVASQLGVFVYPKDNQDQAKQAQDENECYNSAKQQSGIDPAAPPPPPQEAKQAKAGGAKGAAGGAAAGPQSGP